MKSVEEVIVAEKERNTLDNVMFIPPSFGTYTLGSILFGLGIGLLLSDNKYMAITTLLFGFVGMLFAYIKREELVN